ncbi:CDP-alcohol phosphatidyltransferase family protein [Microbacter margulisiae]|uniref:Phosphatidylglycerophosphate synthase n=1 Tax=Microbacter margulisiae TaxID=1350067 RepID=A0A7W5H324_9PORP|nr:CDP-alcohol phosphatidyltransferase family protein [Microbacter margulisiae]MBB3188164.1 phosphatidylglycerophosphate synthase [Microbacter margulisiae]
MKQDRQTKENVYKVIAHDRDRTNILKTIELKTITFLVQRTPSWVTPDMLTIIGFLGTVTVFVSFLLANYFNPHLLLIGVLGFGISWFGDSLDGTLAYYRKKPRKWYGFALDFTTDWLGVILMNAGLIVYLHHAWEFIGFSFAVLYGWEMITALLRYKITNKYTIDSGLFGPTEVRIIVALILILEVLIHNSILYIGLFICVFLFISNITETIKLLKLSDARDKEEMGKSSV